MTNEFEKTLARLTPDIYQSLKRSVELGKWPDGRRLTSEQLQTCMQAVIAYEHQHLPADRHTGFIPPKEHSHCGSDGTDRPDDNQETPLKWQ